jgi:membrane protease YdiL (CAAX protease family)
MHRQQAEPQSLTTADWAVLGAAMLLPTAITWVYFIELAQATPAVRQTAYAIGKSIQFGLPVVWVWLVQRRRPAWPRPRGADLAIGAAFGLGVAVAIGALYLGVLKPSGTLAGPATAIKAQVRSFGADSPAAYLLLAAFYAAIHSLLEEYYWRWFVFGQLRRGTPLAAAIPISSVAFAAHHVLVLGDFFRASPHWIWLFVAGVTIGGAFWAWLYQRSGSLYAVWLSHALVDAAIFAVGYELIAH